MSHHRRFAAAVVLASPIAMALAARAQSATCKDLAAAMEKNVNTPYHVYISTTSGYNGGKTRQSEMISTRNAIYTSDNGKWLRSRLTPQDLAQMQRESADSVARLYTCTRMGSEMVNGTRAQRYHIEGKNEVAETKEDMWLDSSGLIRQLVMDMDVGAGAAGKSHSVMRYEYGNVSAPPGAK